MAWPGAEIDQEIPRVPRRENRLSKVKQTRMSGNRNTTGDSNKADCFHNSEILNSQYLSQDSRTVIQVQKKSLNLNFRAVE